MKKFFLLLFLLFLSGKLIQQTNIISTNAVAEQVMLGNYSASTYMPVTVLNFPDTIFKGISKNISADSLKEYIIRLAQFKNRNSGSDTVSSAKGIGAARRWVYSKFAEFSAANENRLLPSYLQFNRTICVATQHRDIFAVLPGLDPNDSTIIVIEGHIDSRCEGLCDTACDAQGVEDNASGTALVLELARVMSRYAYNHTIVFLVTIAEEQGLYGADAFSDYAFAKGIDIKAVQNNDVVGGIICGQTSSPPSCPGLNAIDSTQVRLFSYGGFNSKHKAFSRFIKLEYQENLLPLAPVPMTISVMSAEDRTGRSGDHVPFRLRGYTAMRFTSANEHGDANVTDTSYTDRQHTTNDTLGVDTNNDQVIDSFFVNFNYLARNAVINGNSAGMLGIGPKTPTASVAGYNGNQMIVNILTQTQYPAYRIGVRSVTNDWDTVYTMTGAITDTFQLLPAATYYVNVMSVDTNGIESLPIVEYTLLFTGLESKLNEKVPVELLQNKPNPFDESTYISFLVNETIVYKEAVMEITDLNGKSIRKIPVELKPGVNEILYIHGYGMSGLYYYTLVIDGKKIATKSMVFAN
jgi:hypothetical protein